MNSAIRPLKPKEYKPVIQGSPIDNPITPGPGPEPRQPLNEEPKQLSLPGMQAWKEHHAQLKDARTSAEDLANKYTEGVSGLMDTTVSPERDSARYTALGAGGDPQMLDAIRNIQKRESQSYLNTLQNEVQYQSMIDRTERLKDTYETLKAAEQARYEREQQKKSLRGQIIGDIIGTAGMAGGMMLGGPAGGMVGQKVGNAAGTTAGGGGRP